VIQNETYNPSIAGDFLAIPEKRSPKSVPKKSEDITIPIPSPN